MGLASIDNTNIKNNWIENIIFSKIITINKPGIIINQISTKYGEKSKQRFIFYLEDTVINLQLDLAKKIGKKDSSELWYKIGKDIGTRYGILSKMKKIPSSMIPLVINHMLMGFRTGGQSFPKKIEFDKQKERLSLTGSYNIICKETGDSGFIQGVISAIASILLGKNIEAKNKCDCPNKCNILLDKKYKQRYISNKKKLSPNKLYNKINFPKMTISTKDKSSFENMMKFKKIEYYDGELSFINKLLLPGEIGMIGIIQEHYYENGLNEIFDQSITRTSELACEDMVRNENGINGKMKKMLNICSILGYGIPSYRISKEKIIVSFEYPPFSKYGFAPQEKMLRGILNYIFNKKVELTQIKFDKFGPRVTFYYK